MAQHSRHQPSSCNNKRRDIGLVWFGDLILLKNKKKTKEEDQSVLKPAFQRENTNHFFPHSSGLF